MDLSRILEKAKSDRWSVGDFDWSRPRPPMTREAEIATVQYFTDMAGIERLAGAMFGLQARKAEDPTLKAIF